MQTFSLRLPAPWAARLDSATVRAWLASYLRKPGPLPPDPGPGDARVSLSLPRPPVRTLAAMHDVPVSVALRRLVAFQSAALPGAAPSLLSPGVTLALERPLAESLDRQSSRPRAAPLESVEPNSGLSPRQVLILLRQTQRSVGISPRRAAATGCVPARFRRMELRKQTGSSVQVYRGVGSRISWWRLSLVGVILALPLVPLLWGKASVVTSVVAGPAFVPWVPLR